MLSDHLLAGSEQEKITGKRFELLGKLALPIDTIPHIDRSGKEHFGEPCRIGLQLFTRMLDNNLGMSPVANQSGGE